MSAFDEPRIHNVANLRAEFSDRTGGYGPFIRLMFLTRGIVSREVGELEIYGRDDADLERKFAALAKAINDIFGETKAAAEVEAA